MKLDTTKMVKIFRHVQSGMNLAFILYAIFTDITVGWLVVMLISVTWDVKYILGDFYIKEPF